MNVPLLSIDELLKNSILTGFFTSFFASVMFFITLWVLKPRIEISPKIARIITLVDGEQVTIYAIKVINRTWIHKVLDVRCELLVLENVNAVGGTNVRAKPVKVIRDQLWFIRRRYFNQDPYAQHAPYASIFGTYENLDQIWNDFDKRLQFRVICKHSLSGFSKVFDRVYYQRASDIVTGQFKFGDHFEII